MKTKEISFTLPFIILLYDCSFFGWPRRKLLVQITPLLLTIPIIPYTIYSTINPLIQSVGSLLTDDNSPAYNIVNVTRWDYLYTQFSVILTYLRLLILPVHQNLDYDYPISHSILEIRTFISMTALLSFFAIAMYLFVKSAPETRISDSSKEALQSTALYRLAAFGIFWFFITLSVESSVIVIRDVIFEHRLYLPSLGIFLTVTAIATIGLIRLQQSFHKIYRITLPLVTGVILVLVGTTYTRNAVWGTWISIWSDTVAKSPNKPRAHNVLGIGYYYDLKFDKALQEYQEAVRLKPDFVEGYFNIGLVYKERKQYAELIPLYFKILSISVYDANHFAGLYNDIGISYAELGELDRSIDAFANAVKHTPNNVEFRNNLAFALSKAGKLDAALQEYEKTLLFEPGNSYALGAIETIQVIKKQKTGGVNESANPLQQPDI
jgi:tetratricopeptide (TPR) repeat protein